MSDRSDPLLLQFGADVIAAHAAATCRRCGCTHNDACHDDERGACAWCLADPSLCSHCQDTLALLALLVAGDGSPEIREDVVIELALHHAEQLQKILTYAASATAERDALRIANATRPDYDLICQDCGRAHIHDTVLPSPIWNQIANPADILCLLCIDRRMAAKGLTAEAEFYFVGTALQSRLYPGQEEVAHG